MRRFAVRIMILITLGCESLPRDGQALGEKICPAPERHGRQPAGVRRRRIRLWRKWGCAEGARLTEAAGQARPNLFPARMTEVLRSDGDAGTRVP